MSAPKIRHAWAPENHFYPRASGKPLMNIPSNAEQNWQRGPEAPVHSDRATRPSGRSGDAQSGPGSLRFLRFSLERSSLSRLAPLLACAGILTLALPASAQDAAEPTEPQPSEPAPDAVEPAPEAPAPVAEEMAPAEEAPAEAEAEVTAPAMEAAAPGAEPATGPGVENLEDIVVTGYRKSLNAALSRKQRSTAQVDAIVADDIADFPDLNLAESLQRIPGIAITRDNGEGNRITVRGLSGEYTRTRLNGMDTRVGIGNNTSRSFDFNLFASELFNSIVVHKTATAELGDGSLGSVVDLNTARPFNYKKGLTFLVSAQGNYNDYSQTVRPRLAGLVNYHDPAGLWGASASVAYSSVRQDEAVSDTVRWQRTHFRNVLGNPCTMPVVDPMTMMTTNVQTNDPGCVDVRKAFHARIPRYGQTIASAERLGLTGGLQFRPIPQTEIKLDALYASFNQETNFRTLEVLFRDNESRMDIADYDLERFPDRYGMPSNTLSYLAVDNAWVRSERFQDNVETDFYQVTLSVDQEFTEQFYAQALGGISKSKGHIPHQTTLMYDDRDYNGYIYDYRQDKEYPRLAFTGPDVRDAGNFLLTELRDVVHTTENEFMTAEIKLFYEIIDPLRLSVGVNYKGMNHDTHQRNRNGSVCGSSTAGPNYGLLNGVSLADCDADDDGSFDAPGIQGRQDLTEITSYEGKVGDGSTTRWATPSLEGWVNELNYYSVPTTDELQNIRTVEENNLGTYLQVDGEVPLGTGSMRILYNAGVNYVQTRQTSGGYVNTEFVERERPMYDDWLPSANLAFWATDDVVLRLAAARVLSRPALSDLTPGGTASGFTYTVSYKNPLLEPNRATALDAAIEWYFAEESAIGVAVFMKDVESFPITDSRTGTFASTGLPTSALDQTSGAALTPNFEGNCPGAGTIGCWTISQLLNGNGATIKGLEVAVQAPLSAFSSNLPPVIRGLGFTGNMTLVDSDREYSFRDNYGNLYSDDEIPPMEAITLKDRLLNLSNTSFNATIYYEDSKFGARLSMANRSEYLTDGPNHGNNNNLWTFTESSTRFDFSSSYNILDELEVSFEALNLTNTPDSSKMDVDAQRLLTISTTGRNFLLGARYTY